MVESSRIDQGSQSTLTSTKIKKSYMCARTMRSGLGRTGRRSMLTGPKKRKDYEGMTNNDNEWKFWEIDGTGLCNPRGQVRRFKGTGCTTRGQQGYIIDGMAITMLEL